jgi:hypothetical protein
MFSRRVYTVLVLPKRVVSDAVRATKVAVVPSKVYIPSLAKVVPEAAVFPLITVKDVTSRFHSGVKNVR